MTDYSSLPLGVDVSHFQLTIDWPTVSKGGAGFAIIKATQGMSTDPMFIANVNGAADAGLITFAYPFLTPQDDEDVVANFLSVTGGMVPALDWERAGVSYQVVERFIKGYEDKSGRTGLAYYGLFPPDKLSALIETWPRWFPEYAPAPKIPAWDGLSTPDWSKEWLIWQTTGNGRLPGVTTAIDLNRCAIPMERLRQWHDTGSFSGGNPAASSSPNPTSPTS